ncbi:hypothetical protein BGZ65_004978, partial [Modicella reniformis]
MSTRHARTADKSANDKHTRILRALLQKPENKVCVDCRKKVKSVDLDNWTTEQVEGMIKWGNEKANLYWEDRLPENRIPNEDTSGIDPWIRSKYEHKQFACKGPVPDPSELGSIDESMLTELYGKSESHARSNRSAASGSSTRTIVPPPPPPTTNPTKASVSKKQPSSSSTLQGADLFSIGQPSSSSVKATSTQSNQADFLGLYDSAPTPSHPPQAQPPKTATQDLFSMTAPSTANGPPNTDWKNSIMSLYGNQSTPKPNAGGFGTGQPSALQGMNAFGLGQTSAQPQPPQQQQFNSSWGNDDPFGTIQQAPTPAPSTSLFDTFNHNSSYSNGFGSSNNSHTNGINAGVHQGGDLFSTIAGATRSPATSPPQSINKND